MINFEIPNQIPNPKSQIPKLKSQGPNSNSEPSRKFGPASKFEIWYLEFEVQDFLKGQYLCDGSPVIPRSCSSSRPSMQAGSRLHRAARRGTLSTFVAMKSGSKKELRSAVSV